MPQNLEQLRTSVERGSFEQFKGGLESLRSAIGPVPGPLPERYSTQELDNAERELTGDSRHDGFVEQFRANEIMHRRRALEQQAAAENGGSAVPQEELITTRQAITYHEYLPGIVQDIERTLQRYQAVRASLPSVPPSLQQQELQASIYLNALSSALRERTSFGNVLLADGKLARHAGDTQQLMQLRERALASADLSTESKAALQGTQQAKFERGNALNQRIIDLLSGKARAAGVEQGFSPQRMYLELLSLRYRAVLDRQKAIVRDQRLQEVIFRRDELKRLDEEAKKNGVHLSADERAEYEALQRQIQNRNDELDRLSDERRFLTDELLTTTDDLGGDQMRRAELTTIQHQFGDTFDFEGVRPETKDQTPEKIRKAMQEQMRQRSTFHLDRMDAFIGAFDREVLGEGVTDHIEDFSNKKGREFVRAVTHKLATMFTAAVPESLGMREGARGILTEPLDKAMGWPAGKDMWEDLTPEEQKAVEEKARSVLDVIRSFDRSKMEQFRSTVSVIRSMPPASEFVGKEPQNPLPEERVTPENKEELVGRYGAPTVYMMLFRQMDGDWGGAEPPTGFLGEYAKLLVGVNKNIDTHIEVGDALRQLSQNYKDLSLYLLIAAGAALFAGGFLAREMLKRGPRLAARLTRWVYEGGKWVLKKAPPVVAAEGQMIGERAVGHRLLLAREQEAVRLVLEDLAKLQKGEDAAGNRLSPQVTDQLSREAAARLFAAVLQTNQAGEATVFPHRSGYENATPNPVIAFEAFVMANDIMEQHGFARVLDWSKSGMSFPEDLSVLSPRAKQVAEQMKKAVPRPRPATEALERGDRYVSYETMISASKSPEMALLYAEYEKTADRAVILRTIGNMVRSRYDFVMELDAPTNHPTGATSLYRYITKTKPTMKEVAGADRYGQIANTARAVADMSPKELVLMSMYLQKNPPSNAEILAWYHGLNVGDRGVEKAYGKEGYRIDFVGKLLKDWCDVRRFADQLAPKPGQSDANDRAIEQARAKSDQWVPYEANLIMWAQGGIALMSPVDGRTWAWNATDRTWDFQENKHFDKATGTFMSNASRAGYTFDKEKKDWVEHPSYGGGDGWGIN